MARPSAILRDQKSAPTRPRAAPSTRKHPRGPPNPNTVTTSSGWSSRDGLQGVPSTSTRPALIASAAEVRPSKARTGRATDRDASVPTVAKRSGFPPGERQSCWEFADRLVLAPVKSITAIRTRCRRLSSRASTRGECAAAGSKSSPRWKRRTKNHPPDGPGSCWREWAPCPDRSRRRAPDDRGADQGHS